MSSSSFSSRIYYFYKLYHSKEQAADTFIKKLAKWIDHEQLANTRPDLSVTKKLKKNEDLQREFLLNLECFLYTLRAIKDYVYLKEEPNDLVHQIMLKILVFKDLKASYLIKKFLQFLEDYSAEFKYRKEASFAFEAIKFCFGFFENPKLLVYASSCFSTITLEFKGEINLDIFKVKKD